MSSTWCASSRSRSPAAATTSARSAPRSSWTFVKVVRHLRSSGQLDPGTLDIVKRVTLDKHELYARHDAMWSS